MESPILWYAIFTWMSLFASIFCQAYDYGVDVSHIMRRQGPGPIVVRGVPTPPNAPLPIRAEIRQLRADPYKWDLFILSLSMFQSVDQNDPQSWYQIAGIHGVPFIPWNGVEPVEGANNSGYCTHNSVLFPMWHRPYLALYEQIMHKMVQAIAEMFTNETQRDLYRRAALDFRIPYWDWSLPAPPGETYFPDVLWTPSVNQFGPNGVQSIRNPLYSYQFHPLDEAAMIWEPLKHWNETKRAPNTTVSRNAPTSNNDAVNRALLARLPEIQQRLYIIYSNYHDFNPFSNKAWAAYAGLQEMDSIESIHDIIHLQGGSKGHMTFVPLSALDPLFFLHHAMADRLIAIWQILNPLSWVAPMPAGESSFTVLKGTNQSASSPLTPFFASEDGTFWTSDTARTTEVLGYTYADLVKGNLSDQGLRDELVRKINTWYGPSKPDSQIAKPGSGADKARRYTEWIANVQVNVEALDGVFQVLFFVGNVPLDANEWETAPSLAGTAAIFAMNRTTGSQSKISNGVPLTASLLALMGDGKLTNLTEPVVEPLLRERLQFRVLSSDKQKVEPELVDGLRIEITATVVTLPKNETELPEWGKAETKMAVWGV